MARRVCVDCTLTNDMAQLPKRASSTPVHFGAAVRFLLFPSRVALWLVRTSWFAGALLPRVAERGLCFPVAPWSLEFPGPILLGGGGGPMRPCRVLLHCKTTRTTEQYNRLPFSGLHTLGVAGTKAGSLWRAHCWCITAVSCCAWVRPAGAAVAAVPFLQRLAVRMCPAGCCF